MVNGAPVARRVPAFMEAGLEYPRTDPPNQPEPPAPSDPLVCDFLAAVAGIAAGAWSEEIDTAKAWPPELEPPFPPATARVHRAGRQGAAK